MRESKILSAISWVFLWGALAIFAVLVALGDLP